MLQRKRSYQFHLRGMCEAPLEADLCWRELVLVAKALADGREMTEVGLMRDVALRTIAVLGGRGAEE